MARYMAPYYAGKGVYGVTGIGIPGATIRALTGTGDAGPGFMYDDWDSSADDTVLFRMAILTWPVAGTLSVDEYGRGTFTDAPDGAYSFTYKLWGNGIDRGDATETLLMGGVPGSASASLPTLTLTAPTATAKGKAKASASFAEAVLTAAIATAKGKARASASSPDVSLSPSTASAKGKARASAGLPQLDLVTATGTASISGGTTGNASAALPSISLVAMSATARGQEFDVPANRRFVVPTNTAPDENQSPYLMQPGAAYEFSVNFAPANGLDGLAGGEAIAGVVYTSNRYARVTELLRGATCKFKVALSEKAPIGVPIPVKIVATTSASPENRLVYTLMILPSLTELVLEA